MPVASFVMGAEDWTPVDHKAPRSPGEYRVVPVGPIHAVEPTVGTSACSGQPVRLHPRGRTFVAWGGGTCPSCSEQLDPRGADTPTGPEVLPED